MIKIIFAMVFIVGCSSAPQVTEPCATNNSLPPIDNSLECQNMKLCLCEGVCAGPATKEVTTSNECFGTYCSNEIESIELLTCAKTPSPNGCLERVELCEHH